MTESPSDLAREAERGESSRTPAILLGATQLTIYAVVAVLAAAMLVVYFVLK
jgi:hypothetical protein